ncbi:uncharacterized protein LOC108732241 [Agrilus planipennis]|uniref:Uncharacterized protein LOC108732241 n=1 Tax=Agrilus planipennis TaxID=224129 RepID=A0A1W4WE93_AGRPL|nr:uncharacterized protein LOC108732241 [Agrilus planipennis]
MDRQNGTSESQIQIDEDDSDCFFLQPASSPYDIKAKIKTANEALSNEVLSETKRFTVKFKDDFTYYEADSTLLDVSSVESEENTQNTVIEECPHEETEETALLEAKLQINLNIQEENVSSDSEISEKIIENKDDNSDDSSKQMTEIDANNCDERCPSVNLGSSIKDDVFTQEDVTSEDNSVDTLNGFDEIEDNEEEGPFVTLEAEEVQKSDHSDIRIDLQKGEKPAKQTSPHRIICRDHCIDRFDSVEEIMKHKTPTPACCPLLRLRKRYCCEQNEFKQQQKLPVYTGKRSEYGMSSKDMQEARKRKALQEKLKIEESRIIEENRRRRIEENEKIFTRWLQDVTKRKKSQHQDKTTKQQRKAYSERFDRNSTNKVRPTTANNKTSVQYQKKKRPQTCPASICIEIPQRILKKGVIIGDVKISTRTKKSNEYHVMEIF